MGGQTAVDMAMVEVTVTVTITVVAQQMSTSAGPCQQMYDPDSWAGLDEVRAQFVPVTSSSAGNPSACSVLAQKHKAPKTPLRSFTSRTRPAS
jgi:hypothetical protein